VSQNRCAVLRMHPPLILSHWCESPFILLVWSDEAFRFATGPNNTCCKFKDQDQIYAAEEPDTFQKLYLKNKVPILVYNMHKSSLSLQTILQSIRRPNAVIYSLNQPTQLHHHSERLHVLYKNATPVDCMLRMYGNEEDLKALLVGTALSEQDEELFPHIVPDGFEF
jgi:hypothetical protein